MIIYKAFLALLTLIFYPNFSYSASLEEERYKEGEIHLASSVSQEAALRANKNIPELIEDANRGDVIAQYELAVKYLKNPQQSSSDPNAGINYLKKASDNKYVPAMFGYAVLLENGTHGVEQNYPQAAALYHSVANNDNQTELYDFAYYVATACYRIGLIYETHEHETLNLPQEQSKKEHFYWYEKGLKAFKSNNLGIHDPLQGDLCYLLGSESESDNGFSHEQSGKSHPLIQQKLLSNAQDLYIGRMQKPAASKEGLEKLKNEALKLQETLADNYYILFEKDNRSDFFLQLLWCYKNINKNSESFTIRKMLLIEKANAIIKAQQDLCSTYDIKQKDQQNKLLKLYQRYVINQMMYYKILYTFENQYEQEIANNFSDLRNYLAKIAQGKVNPVNLKLISYYIAHGKYEKATKEADSLIKLYRDASKINHQIHTNEINLSDVEEAEIQPLLAAVCEDETVTCLILQDKKKLSPIIHHLKQILQRNFNLKRLDLSKNRMTTRDLLALLPELEGNHHLRELILDENNFKTEGIGAILPLIKNNKALNLLSFYDNYCSRLDAMKLIGTLLETRKNPYSNIEIRINSGGIKELFDSYLNQAPFPANIVIKYDKEIINKSLKQNEIQQIAEDDYSKWLNERKTASAEEGN